MSPRNAGPWAKVTVTAEAVERVSELAKRYGDLLDDYRVLEEALRHIAENGSGGEILNWSEFAGETLAALENHS